MKNVLLFAVVLIWHTQGVSQSADFAPVGAKWWVNQIVLEPVPADSFVIVEVTGEEMKDGELCRVITNLSGCGLPTPAHVFTRSDSVFFYSEVTDQFELLYDFTATVGSTWPIKGLSGFQGLDYVVHVINVSFEEYSGNILKTWWIEDSGDWGNRIVEKVGSLWYPGPTYIEYCPEPIDKRNAYWVRCYEENGELIKFWDNPCDRYKDLSPIQDVVDKGRISILPNPGHGSFTINTGLTDIDPKGVLEIFDFSGRNVWYLSGVQPVHLLDLDHLNKGMYALRILTKNGPSIVKFIID